MSNKWIKKLDEQKLVGCEVYNGSTILWAKKIIYKDEVGIQILTIENLFENSNDIISQIENCFIKQIVGIDEEIPDFNNFPKLVEILRKNNLKIGSYEVFDDFCNVVSAENYKISDNGGAIVYSSLEKDFNIKFKNGFGKLLSNFFYMPYYCEFQIDRFERRKFDLEKQAQRMTIQTRVESDIDSKINFCSKKIVDYYSDLNDFRAATIKRDVNAQTNFLDELNFDRNI